MQKSIIYLVFLLLMLFFSQKGEAQLYVSSINDSTAKITVGSISVQGQSKTKTYIITREIIFKVGDTIVYKDLPKILERSKNNIFNTALFNDVKINTIQNPLNELQFDFIIEVKERWYIIPEPVFELYDRNYKVWAKVYNRDIERIRYGVKLKFNNFSGRRDQLRINLVNGFSKELSFNYTQPFADKKLRHGFGIGGGYAKRIGVTYNDTFNAGLPRKLCQTCETPNFRLFNANDYFGGINYQYRKGIYDRHLLSLNYTNTRVSDTVIKSNQNYFWNGINQTSFLDLSYNYTFTKVDYFAYPLKGFSVNTGFRKRFSNDGLNQLLAFATYSNFWKLSKKFYFNTTISGSMRFNQNQNSFFNLRTADLAFGNIRGLEEYLILPKHDIAIRNSIRYKIVETSFKLPVRIRNHERIPLKIYARVFADGAYVYLPNPNFSSLHNKFLRTGGFAIDVVTIYDFVYRFEFSFNQLGKFGLFIR